MQNHGFLAAINPIVSLAFLYKIPLLMLISYRGHMGERDPWQTQGGRFTEPVLKALDIPYDHLTNPMDVERQISRMSRRSLLWGAAAVATGLAGQRWLITRRDDDGIPWPFRRALEINEELARDYFKPSRLAPVFPRALAGTPRENGDLGLSDDFDPATWRLTVVRGAGKGGEDTSDDSSSEDASSDDTSAKGPSSADAASDDQSVDGTPSTDDLKLTLADIQALPHVEMVTELKCIGRERRPLACASFRSHMNRRALTVE